MRAIFGILSLIVVLAIVGLIAKKQLQALSGPTLARDSAAASAAGIGNADAGSRGAAYSIPGGMPGAVGADPNGLTVPQQSRNIQEQVRADTVKALQQGMQRNQRADP